jgi:hypothetical protein
MIASPRLLVAPATEAGIAIPPDTNDYDVPSFPYWHVFCVMQLGTEMPTPNTHFENAKIIASIPDDKIEVVTIEDVLALGFSKGYR